MRIYFLLSILKFNRYFCQPRPVCVQSVSEGQVQIHSTGGRINSHGHFSSEFILADIKIES